MNLKFIETVSTELIFRQYSFKSELSEFSIESTTLIYNMIPLPPHDYVYDEHIAALLGVSVDHLVAWLDDEEFPLPPRIEVDMGGRRLWRWSAFTYWLNAQQTEDDED